MQPYFMTFHVKGEIAGSLLLREPEPKLLVDLSPDPAKTAPSPGFCYPNRVSFTLLNQALIEKFRQNTRPGDVIEASGTFSQSGYIPHKTSHIDTTFQMLSFSLCKKQTPEFWHAGRQYRLADMVWMH